MLLRGLKDILMRSEHTGVWVLQIRFVNGREITHTTTSNEGGDTR